MRNYRMVFDVGTTCDLQWQYDFTIASETMAIEYARSHAIRLRRSLHLWDVTDNERYVISLLVKEPEARAELIRDMRGPQ